jgi:predicted nucleic acid-binding protein
MKYFIDTNIIVYANDSADKKKQDRALEIISDLIKKKSAAISTQVLAEYAFTALKKLEQKSEVILRQISLLESLEVIRQSPDIIRRGIEIKTFYKIGFWDACIIAAAEFAKCDLILTEDLTTGQFYSGIPVLNPFNSSQKL